MTSVVEDSFPPDGAVASVVPSEPTSLDRPVPVLAPKVQQSIRAALGQGHFSDDVITACCSQLTDSAENAATTISIYARFDWLRPLIAGSLPNSPNLREPAAFTAATRGASIAARRLRVRWTVIAIPTRMDAPDPSGPTPNLPALTMFSSGAAADAIVVVAQAPDMTHVLLVTDSNAVELPREFWPSTLSGMATTGLAHDTAALLINPQDKKFADKFGQAVDFLALQLEGSMPLRRPRGVSLH